MEKINIDNKLHNFQKITGIINNTFKPKKALKKTRINLHNTLALSVLLYGSENWNVKARDASRITIAEMKYIWIAAEYTQADHKTNTERARELHVTLILDRMYDYKKKLTQNVSRMPSSRLTQLQKNAPKEKGDREGH
jgi:DNA polymerase III gamma/tau subunit